MVPRVDATNIFGLDHSVRLGKLSTGGQRCDWGPTDGNGMRDSGRE